MANRVQQDTFMDDSDDACPLCVEEFDLSDKNFRPCPCGYQVCQFCYNNIKNNMNGLCPACRRPYDEKNIEWKIVSPEEFKADIAQQARKKAATRQKEIEKRQVETLNKKHLSGLRVVQKNLVYVVGLNPKIREEDLLQTLRGDQYFGQYGKILKIVVSKAKENSNGNQSIGVYVTFARKQDAASCIAAVDGSQNGDRTLRAQYGTTKYCSAYLRNETCNNRNCMFLHETGENDDSFSRQDLSSMNAVSTQRPAQSNNLASSSSRSIQPTVASQTQPPAQQAPVSAATNAIAGLSNREEPMSRSDSGDGSALPTTASWAAKNAQVQESRRSSQVVSQATPSPKTSNVLVKEKDKTSEDKTETTASTSAIRPSIKAPSIEASSSQKPPGLDLTFKEQPPEHPLEKCVRIVCNANMKWSLDRTMYDDATLSLIDNFPPLLDTNGGAIRYAMKKKVEQEQLEQEEAERNILQAMSATEEDDNLGASGSLQLGGEPENQDNQTDVLAQLANNPRNLLHQRPFSSAAGTQTIGGPGFIAADFQNGSITGRSITPQSQQQQQQQLLLQRSIHQDGTVGQAQKPSGTTSHHQTQLSNPFQSTNPYISNLQGHTRQASRFTFANDSATASAAVKPAANPQLLAQQSSMMPPNSMKQFNPQASSTGQHTNFYSGVQGPPPGLKSTGTPPISGGGMFGQGHGFANAMGGNHGFGGGNVSKNTNDDMMRELLRSRSGASNGPGGAEAGKREFMFPSFLHQPMTTTTSPAPGLLSPLYGAQVGSYNNFQDQGPSKQKKKGKKHRHANTSSSGGGGIVDLADPSILQARMHHAGAGPGAYGGGQGQGPDEVSSREPTEEVVSRPTEFVKPALPLQTTRMQEPISRPLSLASRSSASDFPPLIAPPKANERALPAMEKQISNKQNSSRAVSKPSKAVREGLASLSSVKSVAVVEATPTSVPKLTSKIVKLSSGEDIEDSLKHAPTIPALQSNTKTENNVQDGHESEFNLSEHTTTEDAQVEARERRQRPGKLDIAAAKDASNRDLEEFASSARSKPSTPMKTGKQPNTYAVVSHPVTPATVTSQTSAISASRVNPPRTIRVVATPKTETPPQTVPTSAISTPSGTPAPRQPSRRPSMASSHLPGTPVNELISDSASFTTTSMSRPSSPQFSKVGTAPIRQTTKSQQKKERQLRAKLAEEVKFGDDQNENAAPIETVQAPIIGRKKKTKKAGAIMASTDDTSAGSGPSSPATKESIAQKPNEIAPASTPMSAKEPKKVTKASKKGKDAAKALGKENNQQTSTESPLSAENNEGSFQPQKPAVTAASLFAQLVLEGKIQPNILKIFRNVQGLNHRIEVDEHDIYRTTHDTNPELTAEQREYLDNGGIGVIVDIGRNKRCVVLPNGQVLNDFSQQMAERYLELRQTMMDDMGPTAFNSSGMLPDPFKRPMRLRGERAEIPPEFGGSAYNSTEYGIADDEHPQGGLEPAFWDSLQMTGMPPSENTGSTAAASVRGGFGTDMPQNMETLRLSVEKAEKAYQEAKKETEMIEKKLNAVIKKNRRLLVGAGN